ncbi:hypothetical protein CDAR_250941 [Caerostris darwini]|uniref:Uncharacterized protein n=1 Tax=Caerostris darwini TaxID=1538125 RepID=A0AAV4TJD7_9ARAC|nr:hypothetical protein CDAR_250941 [Caerostris darwini]
MDVEGVGEVGPRQPRFQGQIMDSFSTGFCCCETYNGFRENHVGIIAAFSTIMLITSSRTHLNLGTRCQKYEDELS